MKRNEAGLARLKRALVRLDLEGAVRLTRRLNERLAEPIEIMEVCERALSDIGERYASGEYYIAGLIMAGEIMNQIITLLTPRLADGSGTARRPRDKILIGTIKGDIHDLGKNIAGALLAAYGFDVMDLGVDVPGEEFVKAMKDFQPRIVGLSVLLSSCHGHLAAAVSALRKARGDSPTPYIFVSGNQITATHRELFQADFHAATAFDTVRLCERLTKDKAANLTHN